MTSAKATRWLAILITGVAFVGGVYTVFHINNQHACEINIQLPSQGCMNIERADSPRERQLGLSGRQSMTPSHAMLFVFDQPSDACMWMKDMEFDLDMVWLNADKEITKIQENISPETYPESFC